MTGREEMHSNDCYQYGMMYGRRTTLVHVPVTETGQICTDLLIRLIVQEMTCVDDNTRSYGS